MPLEKATTGIIESLKGQPLILALILVNLLTLGYVILQQRDRNHYEREINDKLIACLTVQDMVKLQQSISEWMKRHP
jgi:hypothetical protein